MRKRFRDCGLDQPYLLPPSLQDWLPENHLARLVAGVVEELDLSGIYEQYERKDGRGLAAYHPMMLTRVLLYGYCIGKRSSRQLEKATYEDVAIRYLAADQHPDHDTIAAFRQEHLTALASLFVQVLRLCRRVGLTKLSQVSIDGTKMRANASRRQSKPYRQLQSEEQELMEQVSEILGQAAQADAAEDEQYGKGRRGEELPEDLNTAEKRLAKIRAAKAALEEEARSRHEQARREREAAAGKPRNEAQRKRWQRARSPEPNPEAKGNLVDPDSRVMMNSGRAGFIQGYNAQIAVDTDSHVIVAATITQQEHDKQQLVPVVEAIRRMTGRKPAVIAADSGYWSSEAVEHQSLRGIRVLVPPDAGHTRQLTSSSPRTEAAQLMRRKLAHSSGRKSYARRKGSVEPVFGTLKEHRGYRRFLFRGDAKVSAEWQLICAAHNIRKLCASAVPRNGAEGHAKNARCACNRKSPTRVQSKIVHAPAHSITQRPLPR